MCNETTSLYAKFNIFSLSLNLFLFILIHFLNFFENFPTSVFYVSIVLKITLIFFSCLHYYMAMIREKSQKRSKKLAISLILLENVYDSIPLFEFLIEINLEWSLSSKGNDILSVYILKPSYFFCKQLVNVLYKRK